MLPSLNALSIGAITTVAPPKDCSICHSGLYGCDWASNERTPKSSRGGDARNTVGFSDDRWYECNPDNWIAPRPVVVLHNCGHYFHCKCLAKWMHVGDPVCPLCRVPLVPWEAKEINDTMVIKPAGHKIFKDTTGRVLEVEFPSGTIVYYEGVKGQEHMVRAVLPRGGVVYFEGPTRAETRKVRAVLPDGGVDYYEGPTDKELKVRRVFPDGSVSYFEGLKGEERLVSIGHNGNAQYYKGPKGQERIEREEYKGVVVYYEGLKGEERKVRVVSPEHKGLVVYFEGPNGGERRARAALPDGSVVNYEGPRGRERPV